MKTSKNNIKNIPRIFQDAIINDDLKKYRDAPIVRKKKGASNRDIEESWVDVILAVAALASCSTTWKDRTHAAGIWKIEGV